MISNFLTKIIVWQNIVVLLRICNKQIRYFGLKKILQMSLFEHSEKNESKTVQYIMSIVQQLICSHLWGLQIRMYRIWVNYPRLFLTSLIICRLFFHNSAVLDLDYFGFDLMTVSSLYRPGAISPTVALRLQFFVTPNFHFFKSPLNRSIQ